MFPQTSVPGNPVLSSHGLDLVRLGLTLIGCSDLDRVLSRSLRVLRERRRETTWAILHCVGRGRYVATVRGPIGHRDLVRLFDETCGPDSTLSLSKTLQRPGRFGQPAWCSIPGSGRCAGLPELVLACWNHDRESSLVDPVDLRTAARLIAGAVGSARVFGYLLEQSTRDPLTGLLNRRGIFDLLERERARSARQVTRLSVLFLDLDRFKEVNDRYGHLVGDEVLAAAAGVLSSALRASDAAGRVGGDEFLVVLPDTALGAAHAIGNRLIKRISGTQIPTPHGSLSVSLSYGAAGSEECETDTGLLEIADARMLATKRRRHIPQRSDMGSGSAVSIIRSV